ncbi:YtpR family tRNA-binding protein [Helicobacter baculiformis]|uniref:Phenylalanine--tRNA ligase beta subunit n=1 Tax=Helicobacter baculiformis TaxID=427351 RepID=A0ABV7ZJ21_9HELI|nr:phenylalanine--tRNA ligase subunit beta [Helicobacter baculiformis]
MLLNTYILHDFLEGRLPNIPTLCADLSRIGLEVESATPFELPERVVVGKVLECTKHPNATKLSVCQIDVGSEVLQIVCGARNVQAGQFVAVALVGAYLNACNLHIQTSTLRGVESFGMICSSTELGLPKLNEGILILDSSLNRDDALVLGMPLRNLSFFQGMLLDIALTPNRGDCLSVLGIARELSALYRLPLKNPPKLSETALSNPPKLPASLPPCALGYALLDLDASFLPLEITLTLALQRSLQTNMVSNLLEYTTYLSGVLLHAYSYESLEVCVDTEGFVRVEHASQTLATIGVTPSAPPATSPFLLEASFINPTHLCQSLHRHPQGSATHALIYRSKRGSNPEVQVGLAWLSVLLTRFYPGATLRPDTPISTLTPTRIALNVEEIAQILGVHVQAVRIKEILEDLNFKVCIQDTRLEIQVPLFRHDIATPQDVAEEILRFMGLEQIPKQALIISEVNHANTHYTRYKFERTLASRALALQFKEVVHYLFAKKEKLEALGYPTLKESLDLLNPINHDLNTLRTSLVPGLLEACARNKNLGFKSIALFELGSIYNTDREERSSLAFLASGFRKSPHYPHPKGIAWDFYSFSSALSSILGRFELDPLTQKQRDKYPYLTTTYHPYQSAWILQRGCRIGILGAVNPILAQQDDLLEGFVAEVDSALLRSKSYRAQGFSKLPTSFRDLTILVDENCLFASLKRSLEQAQIPYLKEIFPLDIYPEEKGQIALSMRLKIQSQEPLTDARLQEIVQHALSVLEQHFGARLKR